MSIGIIIRPSGYTSKHHSAPRFVPHFNRSIPSAHNPNGTYFRTKEDYYGTLKKKGMEPYDPHAADSGKRSPYKASKKCREIVEGIKSCTNKKGKFTPSTRLVDAMESMGVKTKMTRQDLAKLPSHYQSGGFYETKGDKK